MFLFNTVSCINPSRLLFYKKALLYKHLPLLTKSPKKSSKKTKTQTGFCKPICETFNHYNYSASLFLANNTITAAATTAAAPQAIGAKSPVDTVDVVPEVCAVVSPSFAAAATSPR